MAHVGISQALRHVKFDEAKISVGKISGVAHPGCSAQCAIKTIGPAVERTGDARHIAFAR